MVECKKCGAIMEKRYKTIEEIPGYHLEWEKDEDGRTMSKHMIGDREMMYPDHANNKYSKDNPHWCPECKIVRFPKVK